MDPDEASRKDIIWFFENIQEDSERLRLYVFFQEMRKSRGITEPDPVQRKVRGDRGPSLDDSKKKTLVNAISGGARK